MNIAGTVSVDNVQYSKVRHDFDIIISVKVPVMKAVLAFITSR